MNRRRFLSFLATLPVIGSLVPKMAADGVGLVSMAHPVGPAVADSVLSDVEHIILTIPAYARAGETITCEEGHPICDFVQTVSFGQTQNLPEHLGNWRQDEPKVGTLPLPVCAVCGSKFTLGAIFHFKEGWRAPGEQIRLKDSRSNG